VQPPNHVLHPLYVLRAELRCDCDWLMER
jgi:hypothetical protein